MRKLIYEGHILINSEGQTDTWKLTIGEKTSVGSLFELRRQINFFQELGVLPPKRDNMPAEESKIKRSKKRLGK